MAGFDVTKNVNQFDSIIAASSDALALVNKLPKPA